MTITLVCTLAAGRSWLLVLEARILHISMFTENFLDVTSPDKGSEYVGEKVSSFVVIFACNVSVRDSSDKWKRFKRKHSYYLPLEVATDHIDHRNHQNTNDCMAFERREGHLLAQSFELALNSCYLFFMAFVLSLDNVRAFELFQLFVEFLDLAFGKTTGTWVHAVFLLAIKQEIADEFAEGGCEDGCADDQ